MNTLDEYTHTHTDAHTLFYQHLICLIVPFKYILIIPHYTIHFSSFSLFIFLLLLLCLYLFTFFFCVRRNATVITISAIKRIAKQLQWKIYWEQKECDGMRKSENISSRIGTLNLFLTIKISIRKMLSPDVCNATTMMGHTHAKVFVDKIKFRRKIIELLFICSVSLSRVFKYATISWSGKIEKNKIV